MQVRARHASEQIRECREESRTQWTAFERASEQPVETITIYYDSHRNLVARGVLAAPMAPRDPRPFPGFVPDPA